MVIDGQIKISDALHLKKLLAVIRFYAPRDSELFLAEFADKFAPETAGCKNYGNTTIRQVT